MQEKEIAKVLATLGNLQNRVFELQSQLTSCKGVGPDNGGEGESAKAMFIEAFLRSRGVTDIVHFDAPDDRVASKTRPNFIATIPGHSKQGLWLFAHMDVVPSGGEEQWKTNPWKVVREGDLVFGRGVEDNQQGLVSMLLLAEALLQEEVTPEYTIHLVFVSDEETGSEKGLKWVLAKNPTLFPKDDLYIVPDGGSRDGTAIQIAEKAVLHLKVTIIGKQCHAATPEKGESALIAACDAIMTLAGLAKSINKRDERFMPTRSTFVPTRHEENIPNINMVSGKEVFYVDCRLLPGITKEEVLEAVNKRLAESAVRRTFQSSKVEVVYFQEATETSRNAPVVTALATALRSAGITPRLAGIGGVSVAGVLRKHGLDAVLWSTISGHCHEPNENSSISATVRDAQIFGLVALKYKEGNA